MSRLLVNCLYCTTLLVQGYSKATRLCIVSIYITRRYHTATAAEGWSWSENTEQAHYGAITIGLTNKECDTTHAPAALPFGFTPTEQLGVQTPGCRMVAPAGRLPDAAAELPPGSCTSSRLGGGAAKPRCCAALALTQPPPAKGLYASTRCPAETATLIKIRVFFASYHTYVSTYL